MREPLDRRGFLIGASASLAAPALARQEPQDSGDGPRLTHGPFQCASAIGVASFWARASEPGEYVLELVRPFEPAEGQASLPQHIDRVSATATAKSDFTLRWDLAVTGTPWSFVVRVSKGDRVLFASEDIPARPLLAPDLNVATLAFGSCADERKFPEQPIWSRILARQPDLVALIGDTPYIDSTELAVQRERYAKFYSQPELAALLRAVPFIGTWDDHDFAGNDLFGAVAGRENSRRAFLEYHGSGEWGSDGQGVFTSRRVGPIELFLLDTRWFADTEPSPFDATKKTLLGAVQWKWLSEALKRSTAPIKALCSGMIWNDATRPGKLDFWGHWPHERDGLFAWLGREKITGVVLVSGDIHRTRVVRHATQELVGYELLELITSPLANMVIESANAEHPGLLFDAGVEQSCLIVKAETRQGTTYVRADFLDAAGKLVYWIERTASSLGALPR